MKRNYLQAFAKLFILCFTISLINSCRTESLADESQSDALSQGKIHSRKVFPDEFRSVNGLNRKFQTSENILKNRLSTGKNILDGAIIDSAYAIETTDGNTVSYTFPVYRNNQKDFFENLVLHKKVGEQNFKSYLYKYPRVGATKYDNQHIEIYNIDNISNTTGKLNFVTTSSITGCYEIQTTSADCGFKGHHTNGQYCPQSGAYMPNDYLTIFDNCPPIGGGGGGSENNNPGNNNPSPGPGNYGVTTPVPDYPRWGICSERTGAHWNALELNSNQLSFINTYANRALRGEMVSFFANNDVFTFDCNAPRTVSPDVKAVGLWIINYAMTNPDFLNSEFWANFVNGNLDVQQATINYLSQNNLSWSQAEQVIDFIVKFVNENPDTEDIPNIFNRIKALDNALAQNPNLLLDIPCNKLDDWKPMADHQIPQSVKDKLKNINTKTHWYQDDLIIQNLDNAQGKSLNMDLFTVKISNLPNKPGTTQKFTAKEFFDYFRLHLNDFAETFTPVVDTDLGVNDTALWNSTNPLNALISIYIPVIVGHNNGTVICSGVTSNTWVFTTITSPWDSEHPVSGNRFFSYFMNPNDNAMYIYTRGLDRVNLPIFNNLSPNNNPAFNGADELWSSMQAKIKKFVKDNGGGDNGATIMSPEIYRPDWVKVKDYLRGNKPLSSLGCK